jgi:putative Mn2+ efflux pump MntP
VGTILLVALSLGLTNFAAAIGLGLSGIDARRRVEVAIVFGAFEVGMPFVGLLLGHRVADQLGTGAQWLGGGLLIVAGLFGLWQSLRGPPGEPTDAATRPRLVLMGFVLSIDNLVVGFALGDSEVPVVVAAVTIGLVSVGLSVLGLELGSRLGPAVGDRAELVGSVVLVGVGALVAGGVL